MHLGCTVRERYAHSCKPAVFVPVRKTTFRTIYTNTGGQYRILLILLSPLVSTLLDCELWWLNCGSVFFLIASTSYAVILLRPQRTTLHQYCLRLNQQFWKGLCRNLTVLLAYFPLLCFLLPLHHLLRAPFSFLLTHGQN